MRIAPRCALRAVSSSEIGNRVRRADLQDVAGRASSMIFY
jgi:hypothetical protein